MDFEERARKAHRRGQLVRAAVLLAEGLKRHPGREDALDFLTNLFANELTSPGLEQDLVDALEARDDRSERVSFILERYAERDKPTMGRELARAANERFGRFEWPPPTPEPPPPEPSASDSDNEASLDAEAEVHEAVSGSDDAEVSGPDAADETSVSDPETSVSGESSEEAREEQLRGVQARLSSDQLARAGALEEEFEQPAEPEMQDDASSVDAQDEEADEIQSEEDQPKENKPEENKPEENQPEENQPEENQSDAASSSVSGVSRRVGVGVAFVTLVLLVAASYAGWKYWGETSTDDPPETRTREIESLDTSDRDAMPQMLGSQTNPGGVQSRFEEAAYALDWGERLSDPVDGDDRLSLAYQTVYHVQNDDFESAIADVTRLEQRFPGELSTLWARGVLEEGRGRFEKAYKAYAGGAKRYAQFVPFWTGQLRIRAMQGRTAGEEDLFDRLNELSSDHPYHLIQDVRWPSRSSLFSDEPVGDAKRDAETEAESPMPRIVRATNALDSAVRSTERADRVAEASRATEWVPSLAPAQLLLGVLEAAQLDVDASERAFAQAAGVDGISQEFSWLLQTAAQHALSSAGRPDRGLRFAVPFDIAGADTELEAASWVPESLADPLPPSATVDSKWAAEALALRSLLLADIGLFATAEAQLESARSAVREDTLLRLVEVRLRILEGKRNSAIRVRRQMTDSPHRELALAAVSFHDGDYQVAIEAARRAMEAGVLPHLAARYAALSLAADGFVRQALAHLEEWDGGPVWAAEFRAVRMRVLSRVDSDSKEVAESYDAFVAVEPRGVARHVDVAGTDFWRKQFGEAAKHLQKAEALAPKYPETNWLLSLVARSSRSVGDVEVYLSGSWRSQSGDASLLLELAQIQLDLERYPQARQLFYRALLADRTSIEAIRGMGRAYLGYDVARGRRDMAGLVENYGTDSRALAPKAEVYRWLAVLEGVRKGSEKGYSYLQKATELVGETPPLLVEQARYDEANGQPEAARRSYARALERDSSFASAHLGLARMALESGDTSVARTHLERYLDLSGTKDGSDWARERLDAIEADAGSNGE